MSSYFLDDLREELRAAATRQAAGEHPRRARIVRRGAIAVVALAAAAALFAGVRALSDSDLRERPARPSATTSVDPDAAKHFAVLRRPPGGWDPIPKRWQRQLALLAGGGGSASITPDFAAARRAGPDMTVWVVPGDGGVCLFEVLGDGTGFGCDTTARAVRGLVYGTSSGTGFGLPGTTRRVSGLLPDGASDVTLRTRDGMTRPVAVNENVYTIDVPTRPVELTWTDAGGTARTIAFFSDR